MKKAFVLIDKYKYVRTNPYAIKLLGLTGVVTSLIMGYGIYKFLQINILYMFLFGPIVVIFLANKTLRYGFQLFYQKFDIHRHQKFVENFWSTQNEPAVDIFLPWAGENLDMHEEVLEAVSKLNYRNYKVYMLDDAGSIDHKNLAHKYEFNYLTRPNRGEYKKSGNLKFGYDNSDGEFVLILDADFIPQSDMLHDLIPYIKTDTKIGILQTPQYFTQTHTVHQKSKIEYGGGNIVEEFYRIIMPCRDEFKAAMCVGTSAIYRRDTILKLQGTPKVHASEDLATGLAITQHGYYVKYLPLILSTGKSPDTIQGYFRQHLRWCSGNVVFVKYWPKAKLSLVARLIYLINPLYYLSEGLSMFFAFQFLLLLYFHPDSLSLAHTFYFFPYLIFSGVIIPLSKINKEKVGTKLAAISNSYTYLYTFIRLIFKGIPVWLPAGVKYDKLQKDFLNAVNLGKTISTLYIFIFLYILFARSYVFLNHNTFIVLLWAFYTTFWHVYYLFHASSFIHPLKMLDVKNSFDKIFLYAKTHYIVALYALLLTVTLFNVILTVGKYYNDKKVFASDNFSLR